MISKTSANRKNQLTSTCNEKDSLIYSLWRFRTLVGVCYSEERLGRKNAFVPTIERILGKAIKV